MEEENEKVVEETTQEQTVEAVDESKFESAGNDNVTKVDLSAPPLKEKIETEVVAKEKTEEAVTEVA